MFEMSIIKQSNSDLSVFKDKNGTKIAVAIENLCFTYVKKFKANPALNGTKLRVPLGKIYALLGPNGCGKTTLLKTVIGMLKPEFGYVSVFGYRPRTISSGVPGSGLGYMPQEFALQTNLTLSEIMLYFGRIYSLDNDFLLEQIEWLVDTLELPPKDTFIEDMGEGQKRRSSLALAIMHKPRLLVLDEPTVGVDPMLCQMIWDLIRKISERDSTTILMTTHYLDEAKKAHCVGFMRKGQMLAEGPPMTLLAQYRAKSLEEIFFKLCLTQKRKKSDILNADITRRSSIMTVDNIGLSYVVREPMNQFRGTLSLYLTIVWVMVRKHMIEVLREPGTFVSLFLFQLFATVLLYACIGSNEVSTRAGWIEVKPYCFSNRRFSHTFVKNASRRNPISIRTTY